jgi:cytochrome c oxidase subunit 3
MTTSVAAATEVQFEDLSQQRAASVLGMWVFLATEVLFFGTLLFGYAYARIRFPEAFGAASRESAIWYGTANTAVLLTSGLTMALAVRAAEDGERRLAIRLLAITAFIGLAFLGVKFAEYAKDYQDHLIPLVDFRFEASHYTGALVFWGFYFLATALHALHLTIGICVVSYLAWWGSRHESAAFSDRVDVAGLYWGLVDIVWVVLYPSIYLVGRAQ